MSGSPEKQQSPATSPKAAGASESFPKSPPSPATSPKTAAASKSSPKSPVSPAASPKAAQASESPPRSPLSPAAGDPQGIDVLEVDAEAEDPTLEDGNSMRSSDSITSSILKYRTLYGRTYHSDRSTADYWGSNDDAQNESMDLVYEVPSTEGSSFSNVTRHHLLTLAIDGRLCLAPIKDDIRKAVDIGTGTGIWAIDFGDAYPGCEVIGTDVSPIQSTWVPHNVKFLVDDCEQEWIFDDNSIDYVHMRYLTGSIKDWYRLFEQAARCTKPGGWVESYESAPYLISDDDTIAPGSAIAQWGKFFIDGGKITGRSFLVCDDGTQRAAMEKAGLVDIQERSFKAPWGVWPKDPRMKQMGLFATEAVLTDTEGYVLYMATLLGWSREEVMVYAAKLRNEIRDTSIHPYFHVKVVWGKKPEAA